MFDLKDLYQEVIIDHNRRPRNHRKMDGADRHAEGFNPLCGDKVNVYLKIDDGAITDASFEGSGCAISVASASLMTEQLKGKTFAQAQALFHTFHDLVTDSCGTPEGLGKLGVFSGVRQFPARVKCATLCWHTLDAALEDKQQSVSTESL
ncbi:MAG: Fe-S cluster assembly sulfur transfer protein SufU [Gammaproteobacteria bacterium]